MPTDKELMQQALDALEYTADYDSSVILQKAAIEALRERLAQPEPEPVAYHNDYLEQVARTAVRAFHRLDESPFGAGRVLRDIALDMIEYAKKQTAPPRKEWQGLTDEDLDFWGSELGLGELGKGVLRAVEDHLKEKNA